MNGKQAKRLRRGVHALTVGRPWRRYQQTNARGTIALRPDCGRKVYRWAKRAFMRYGRHA